ncbi:MAG: 5-(carboxyamino)imidazole ribonucleotide mutase [Bdellovibrionia bacterium]
MGSKTDYKILEQALVALKEFNVGYHVEVVSAHRTPEKMFEFASQAHLKGFQVIIAGAGGAAHLPGMVASLTPLPVIGVPIQVGSLKGLDALLSIAQMPKGVPVACMAVDNAYNAGLFAVRILASQGDDKKMAALEKYRQSQTKLVKKMNQEIRATGKKR